MQLGWMCIITSSPMSLFALIEPSDWDRCAQEAVNFAQKKLPLGRNVSIEWKNYSSTAGRAYLEEGRICLSKTILVTETRIKETALHEYAHIWVFDKYGYKAKPHGAEWKRAMKKLGLPATVCHSYEVNRKSIEKHLKFYCEKCGAEILRIRPLKRNRIYSHVGCGGRIGKKIPKVLSK